MRVYLLRHGTAEPRSEERKDGERKLLPKGREQCRLIGRLLRRMKVEPALVLSSPLRRAAESATEVAGRLRQEVALRFDDRLAPGAAPAEAIAAIVEDDPPCVVAVGHEPLLSQIAARLLGARGLRLDLRKGGLIEIALDEARPPRGVLLGVIRPGHLA